MTNEDKRISKLESLGTDALMQECVRIARKLKPKGSPAVAVEIAFCGHDQFSAAVRHDGFDVVNSYYRGLYHGHCATPQRALATAVVMLRDKAKGYGIVITRKRSRIQPTA